MDWQVEVTSFVRGWQSTRRDTHELLACLDDHTLSFHPPGATWKPLSRQFNCLGRTQHVYMQALRSGRMDYALFAAATLPAHDAYRRREELRRFLDAEDEQWLVALHARAADPDFVVAWPGGALPLVQHISALQEHERLHHGQFIAYFTFAQIALPADFRADWGL